MPVRPRLHLEHNSPAASSSFWVSVPHTHSHSVSWHLTSRDGYFCHNGAFCSEYPCKSKNIRSPRTCSGVAAGEKKKNVMDYFLVTPAVWHFWVMLSGKRAGSAPLWEETERFLSERLFIAWHTRQREESGPHQRVLVFVCIWAGGSIAEHGEIRDSNLSVSRCVWV